MAVPAHIKPQIRVCPIYILSGIIFWVDFQSDSIKYGYSLNYGLYPKLGHVISFKMDKLYVTTCECVGYNLFEEEMSKSDQ